MQQPEASPSATWRLRAAGLRLWPDAKPDVPPIEHGWVHVGNERLLRRLIGERRPRIAIELGSWLGLCTRLMLEAAPELALFAIDLWDPRALLGRNELRAQYERDASAMTLLTNGTGAILQCARAAPTPARDLARHDAAVLHATFLANCWSERHRLYPLRMDTLDGLRAVSSLGAAVDLIYVDADHSEPAVAAELRLIGAARAWRASVARAITIHPVRR